MMITNSMRVKPFASSFFLKFFIVVTPFFTCSHSYTQHIGILDLELNDHALNTDIKFHIGRNMARARTRTIPATMIRTNGSNMLVSRLDV